MKQKNITFNLRQVMIMAVLSIALLGCGSDATEAAIEAQDEAGAAAGAPAEQTELDLPLEVDVKVIQDIRNRDDVVLIDVREQWEFDEGHIPGVTLIPLGQVEARLSEIPTDQTVVMVCRSGNRSGQATSFLRQQGLDNVHNMQGGMLAWEANGYEVEQ